MSSSAIEVRVGRGDPSAMALNPGKVLDPTSIGRAGMWRVDGPGVLDVHGYIYFDGKALYVQSADDKQPIMVNKHRVSTAWTEVQAGSTIEVGRAELFYRAAGAADADATIARPMGGEDPDSTKPKRPSNPTIMPAQPPKPGAAFRPGAGTFANRADDESTRLRPMGDEGPPTNQAPRPAAGAPMARPNIGRPMMEPQESTVIAPIEDLSGGRGLGPRPGMGGPSMMGGGPGMGPGMGAGMNGGPGMMPGGRPGMPGMGGPGGPGMGMPGQMGAPPGMGMPGQMGAPPGMGMPGQMGGQMGAPGQPWGTPGGQAAQPTMQQPAVQLSGFAKFKADFETYPPARKAGILGGMFVIFGAIMFLMFGDDGSAADTPKQPQASTSASTSPSTVPSNNSAAMNAGMQGAGQGSIVGGGMQGNQNPAGMQGSNPFPGGSSNTPDNSNNPFGNSGGTAPTASTAATTVAATPDAGAKPPKGDAPEVDAGIAGLGQPVNPKNRTNERIAADTEAEGNYALAERMYEALAQQHPDNPAFSEAAAILRARLDGGAPPP